MSIFGLSKQATGEMEKGMATAANTAEPISTGHLTTGNKFTLGGAGATAVSKTAVTIIGPDALFRGDIKSKGDIVISGAVEGEVASEGKLVIAQGGSVTGRISANEVALEGRLTGDAIATKSLSILSSAQVKGDVTTPVIMIEPGAAFVGRCSMAEQAV
jgi:cytoskeletal protein CcmA (bactofilin family)